jgi:quinolinate synthase
MVTSGSALDVVRYLDQRGEKILWAPDRYLGDYVHQETGADMLLWNSACIVHEEFKATELAELRQAHPAARVLVHPESPAAVIAQADVVASTSGLIAAVRELDAVEFIVATDAGIFYKMQAAAPGKTLIEAPTSGRGATCKSCAHCPWMAMNRLGSLAASLRSGANEIILPRELCERAQVPIKRLLDFADARQQSIYGNNDA